MQWRSAEHYRKRARELRDAAAQTSDAAARDNLLDLARQYDEMAEKTVTPKPDESGSSKRY